MSTVVLPLLTFSALPRELPAGYSAAPISETERAGVVRVCVVVRNDVKQPGASLVALRETIDAKVLLGCLIDSAGRVHDWLEVWVQDIAGLSNALPAYRGAMNNKLLDERWRERAAAAAAGGVASARTYVTGWETSHPAPMFIDVKKLAPIAPKDRKSGAAWALCTDEALLERKGVPAYGATLSRHLYQPAAGEDTPLIPLDVIGADPATMNIGETSEVAAVNGGGGLLMVRGYCPLSYEQYVDALTGVEGEAGPADAILKSIASAAVGAGGTLVPKDGRGWLMIGGADSAGRMVEALHLKLMALAGAIASVRAVTAMTQTPLLNLTAGSFRVSLGEGTGALPLWWTARSQLVEPGHATELPIEGTQAKYYVTGKPGGMSVYAPASMGQAVSGKGWLRLRNVTSDGGGGSILEGTLQTQERLSPGSNDLLWLRFGVGTARVDLYAVVDQQGGFGQGETRIRTIAHRLPQEVVARLNSALGVPIPEVHFELVPLLSTPCDLYALGVLAVRTLLVSKKRALPVALDEVLSLAFQSSRETAAGEELEARLMAVFEKDKRWAEGLGPQNLTSEAIGPDEAMLAIPPRLWFGALAATIRMFTGLSADSRCKDFGDAPAGGVHKVFDGVLEDLYALLKSCRSLIVSDSGINTEIRAVVEECLGAVRR